MIKILICLMLLADHLILAQFNPFSKETELQKFVERGGKYEETSPNIYKLTYPDGVSRTYNLNHTENIVNRVEGIDTTIINVWEIDTTQFNDYFTFWQKVQVANSWWMPLPIEDLNKNKRPELYGYTDTPNLPYPPGGPVRIFEKDTDGIFKNVFEYDSSTIFVKAMGDIHRTGGKEIYLHSKPVNNGVVYRSDTIGVLPTAFDFTFYYTPNQINDMTFGDFDKNNIADCAFIDASNPSSIVIGEYRDSINNFITLFQNITEGDEPSGFAIEDFDHNGNINLVSSTGNSNVLIIENKDINQYSLVNQFPFPYFNAYMQAVTNDIDGNGRLEFWIGGQDFVEGITLYQCYEAISENSYQVVSRIELRYSVSFTANYLQAVDIDDDGKQEIIISSGNNIFVLKFNGSSGNNNYKLLYAKLGEATQPGAEFYPCAIADLDGDGKKDILIPFSRYEYPITYAFSYIIRQDNISRVEYDPPNKIALEQNYPNPFNPSTTIRFDLPEYSNVSITVYDILGKEIKRLVNENLSSGEHTVHWDGKDSNGIILNSGVYFIRMKANGFQKTIKTILMK